MYCETTCVGSQVSDSSCKPPTSAPKQEASCWLHEVLLGEISSLMYVLLELAIGECILEKSAQYSAMK